MYSTCNCSFCNQGVCAHTHIHTHTHTFNYNSLTAAAAVTTTTTMTQPIQFLHLCGLFICDHTVACVQWRISYWCCIKWLLPMTTVHPALCLVRLISSMHVRGTSLVSQRLQEPIGSSRPGIAVGYGPDWRSRDETGCRARVVSVCAATLSFWFSIERVSID